MNPQIMLWTRRIHVEGICWFEHIILVELVVTGQTPQSDVMLYWTVKQFGATGSQANVIIGPGWISVILRLLGGGKGPARYYCHRVKVLVANAYILETVVTNDSLIGMGPELELCVHCTVDDAFRTVMLSWDM